MKNRKHCKHVCALAALTALSLVTPAGTWAEHEASTKTPVKHVVVIFQENVSFDHYFGTYPHAFNLAGETPFHAKEDTPEANSLLSSGLITNNPNSANPFRIPPSVPVPATKITIMATNRPRPMEG
jgi:phospholipase C